MRRKVFFSILIVALVLLPLLGACATSAPSSTPGPTSVPASPKPIELKFASIMPPVSGIGKLHQQWIDKLQEASAGKLKITYYPASSLLTNADMYRGVQSKIADMGLYQPTEKQGYDDLQRFITLPVMGFKSWRQADNIYREVFSKFPEFEEEYRNNGLMTYQLRVLPCSQLLMSKRQLRVPSDLKGAKIQAFGLCGEFVAAAGGAPVMHGPGEWASDLSKGVTEGIYISIAPVVVFGCGPDIKYHTDFGDSDGGFGAMPNAIIINLEVWNSLPPDIQKVFKDVEPWLIEENYNVDVAETAWAKKECEQWDMQYVRIDNPQDMQLWKDVAQPIHDKWIAEMEAQGKPAKAVYDAAKKLIQELPAK